MQDPNQKHPEPTTISEELLKIQSDQMKAVVASRAGRTGGKIRFAIADVDEDGQLIKTEDDYSNPLAGTPLAKSVVTTTHDLKRGQPITSLAFAEDPTAVNYFQSLWVPKITGFPDGVLKQISYRDSLVNAILATRAQQISAFGRELQDRFATGFRIEPRKGVMEDATNEQKEALQKRIEDASHLLSTCGSLEGVDKTKRMSMSTFLSIQTRNGLVFGRFATEIRYTREADGERKFHSIRPVDAGTIYRAAPRRDSIDPIRKQALHLLQQLKGQDGERLKPEKFENDEYAYVQVIAGKPRQAFTPDELIVHNLFPCTDIELRGYPLTPMDSVGDGIATHLNIVQHNKLYFQSGRAARGMIVIKSMDADQGMVQQMRQHFNASINSVSNAWRVPVFGIDPQDAIEWQPFEMGGGRDMEFQFLSDQNAREICSSFQISPEELPGYQHLSRGTNSQALSESSNEYKLEAARDVGIRPLLNQFQDFINEQILPLIDPAVAKFCTLKLYGLDADTQEKENVRITEAMQIDGTMDEILERREKDPIGKEWGGQLVFNPNYRQILDAYFPVGKVKEFFFDDKEAGKNPDLQYYRDPFWFQFQSLKMQAQQMEMQAQQAQQQAQMQAQQPQEGEEGGEEEGGKEPQSELAEGADQALEALGKSEQQLPPGKRKLLALHKKIVKDSMDAWENDSKETLAEVLKTVNDHKD